MGASHPARGGWIEIRTIASAWTSRTGPTPHGVGGLKSLTVEQAREWAESHPARGGWIEISPVSNLDTVILCPTPHGVGGLKCFGALFVFGNLGPTPHGVGGLKCGSFSQRTAQDLSHPARGGWIEIRCVNDCQMIRCGPTPHGVGGLKCRQIWRERPVDESHPARGGWIEIQSVVGRLNLAAWSHPARGGWIEIKGMCEYRQPKYVPPRTGWVD